MSEFSIYRAGSSDPKASGRTNKRLYILYTIFFFLLILTINSYFQVRNSSISPLIYYIVLCSLITTTGYLIFRMRRQIKNLDIIGNLEFTKTCIRKKIGDLVTTYNYTDMNKIEVEKYFRDISISGDQYGSSTYLVKITGKDSTEDKFIVSNKSIDPGQKAGIVDTLKTLKSITGLKIINK